VRSQGFQFEERAVAYLKSKGWQILAQNYSSRFGEIDIICLDPLGAVVFVEVKARASLSHGSAAEMVTASKQAKLIKTAQDFASLMGFEGDQRFDVITFDGEEMTHIPSAFGLDG
jgi:putative endonuclease